MENQPELGSQEWENKIYEAFLQKGQNVTRVAADLGVNPSIVAYVIRRIDPKLIKRGRPPGPSAKKLQKRDAGPRNREIIALRQGGKSLQELGDIFGLTRERIRQIIKKYSPETIEEGKRALKEVRWKDSLGFNCATCGKDIRVLRHRQKRSALKRFYCSRYCSEKDKDKYKRYERLYSKEAPEVYNLRRQGLKWSQIYEKVFPEGKSANPGMVALALARRYAKRNSLPWPV